MNGASSLAAGLPSTDYYAPDFKVEVEGRELDPESKGDVLEVKVVMDMENLTSCELTVNNWDDKHLRFKYSDTDTFDVGNRVHVQMGYADGLKSMMRGLVSNLSPRFPESGPPTIAVTVLDSMFKLRDRKPTKTDVKRFTDKADWEIAEIVAKRNGLDTKLTKEGEKHDLVIQKNQDDALFLKERAARIDFDCYVQTDPATKKEVLHFVRPTDARDSQATRVYQLEWGTNLINFNPSLNVSDQVAKVTVRGWSPAKKKAISYTATPDDLPAACREGFNGPVVAEQRLNKKEETVIDAPVTSEQEAKDLAISLLTERAYKYITGNGRVIGLPDLRPGDNLEIEGLGTRFSGVYYVKKVEHVLGSSGYTSQFEVRRLCDGGTES